MRRGAAMKGGSGAGSSTVDSGIAWDAGWYGSEGGSGAPELRLRCGGARAPAPRPGAAPTCGGRGQGGGGLRAHAPGGALSTHLRRRGGGLPGPARRDREARKRARFRLPCGKTRFAGAFWGVGGRATPENGTARGDFLQRGGVAARFRGLRGRFGGWGGFAGGGGFGAPPQVGAQCCSGGKMPQVARGACPRGPRVRRLRRRGAGTRAPPLRSRGSGAPPPPSLPWRGASRASRGSAVRLPGRVPWLGAGDPRIWARKGGFSAARGSCCAFSGLAGAFWGVLG